MQRDDFAQIDTIVASHGLTMASARAHLAIKLDTERLDAESHRNYMAAIFAIIVCFSAILYNIGQIMQVSGLDPIYINSVYVTGVILGAGQIFSTYRAYQAAISDIQSIPFRKLYIHLKCYEAIDTAPDAVSAISPA